MFECDKAKSDSNKQKHGIDFVEAQALWDDTDSVEITTKPIDEPRYMVIGIIGSKHWSAIVAYRDDVIRLISARRSRKEEIKIYEENNSKRF